MDGGCDSDSVYIYGNRMGDGANNFRTPIGYFNPGILFLQLLNQMVGGISSGMIPGRGPTDFNAIPGFN
jgi:hypothetical protein